MPKTNGMHIVILLALVCACLSVVPVWAQKSHDATSPKYDSATETKLKVAVEEVKLPSKGSGKDIVYMLVKSGTEEFDVYLCPKSFLDDMGVSFSKADEIGLIGSKVKQGDSEIVLAREVVKGNDTVVLRDGNGKPVW